MVLHKAWFADVSVAESAFCHAVRAVHGLALGAFPLAKSVEATELVVAKASLLALRHAVVSLGLTCLANVDLAFITRLVGLPAMLAA